LNSNPRRLIIILFLFFSSCSSKFTGEDNRESLRLETTTIYESRFNPKTELNPPLAALEVVYVTGADSSHASNEVMQNYAAPKLLGKDPILSYVLFVNRHLALDKALPADSVMKLAAPYLIATSSLFRHHKVFAPFDFSLGSLAHAAQMGDMFLVRYILKNNKSLPLDMPPENWTETLLQFSAGLSWDDHASELTETLLTAGANPNLGLPLEIAVNRGNRKTVNVLLRHGANPHLVEYGNGGVDKDIWNDLIAAKQSIPDPGCRCTVEHGKPAPPPCSPGDALAWAVYGGDLVEVKKLLGDPNKPDLNIPSACFKQTLLQLAVSHNYMKSKEEILKELLRAGADPTVGAVLSVANSNGPPTGFVNVKILLEAGQDPGAVPILPSAVSVQDTAMVIYMLEKYPAVLKHQACDAVHTAVVNNNVYFLQLLTAKGVNIKGPCGGCGFTPLHVWTENGGAQSLRYLLDQGVNINAQDSCNLNTALHHALHPSEGQMPGDKLEIILLLLDGGADVNLKNDVGTTALMMGLDSDDEVVKNIFRKLNQQPRR
jgi:ankyrin repeat protein